MDQDLKNLIESPEFEQYHKRLQEPRKFNPFDVLRYADYEIRHSNVLAWLLQPSESHGLHDKFLRAFVQCLDLNEVGLDLGFSTNNVRVERELDYVDITIFLDDARFLIAVENKVVEIYSEAAEQLSGYHQMLQKYKGSYTIHSVLMTASSEENAATEPVPHVSWQRVHEIIEGLYPHDFSEENDVRRFVRQYLEVVKRFVDQTKPGGDFLKKLLDTRGPTLKRLSEENGQSAVRQVDEPRRSSLERLLGAFQQRPADQRSEIRNYLKRKGIDTTIGSRGTNYWLYWQSDEVKKALKLEWCLIWSIGFSYRNVTLTFYSPPWVKEPAKKNTIRFMQRNPIDTSQPPGKAGKYPMEEDSLSYFYVYRNRLLTEDQLSTLSFQESVKLLCGKLDDFFARGSDHERIDTSPFKVLIDTHTRT